MYFHDQDFCSDKWWIQYSYDQIMDMESVWLCVSFCVFCQTQHNVWLSSAAVFWPWDSCKFDVSPAVLRKQYFHASCCIFLNCVLFEKLEGDRLICSIYRIWLQFQFCSCRVRSSLKNSIFIFIFNCVLFKKLEEDHLIT